MNDMSDTFLYTTPLDPRAQPLIDELIHEYDSRYGTYFNAEGAAAELNRYPPEAFAPPHGNHRRRRLQALRRSHCRVQTHLDTF